MSFSEWKQIELGELIDSISIKHKFDKNELIFLNTSDVLEGKVLHQNYSDINTLPGQAKKSIKKGDILFSEIRPKNKRFALVNFDADDYVVSTKLMVLRTKTSLIDNLFLYKYLTSDTVLEELQFIAEGRSGTFPQITFNELKSLKISLPPLNEQKEIADILLSLDEKIELNNQMNETLEEIAQALFKRWFVDFEFPNEEGKPYKSGGGEMVESELGMIPKGWKKGQLEDICIYSSDKIIIENLDKNNYISTENMLPNKGGIIEASSLPTTSKVTSFNNGDTLISNIRPYFKKIYYCNQSGGCSNDVLCFNPKLKDYSYCLYLYLYEDKFFDYMMAGSKGTKMPRGDKKQIMRYPIVIANRDIYVKFNKIVSPMFEKLLTLKEENKNLIKLRDSLLPKLMSGEIRVSDLES